MNNPKLIYWTAGEVPAERAAVKDPVPRPAGVECVEATGRLFTFQRGAWDLQVPAGARWVPVVEEGGTGPARTWVAVDAAGELSADSLWRGVNFGFHMVEMAGCKWKIPVARAVAGNTLLPAVRGLDEEGARVWKVRPEYEPLREIAVRAFDSLTADGAFSDEDGDRLCALALGAGYRIGLTELLALECLDGDVVREIVEALIDWPTVKRIQAAVDKKKGARALGGGS